MKKLPGLAKSRGAGLLASAFVPVCIGMFIGGAGPAKLQSPLRSDIASIKIINKTTTLEVLSLRPTDHDQLVILLKNGTSKALNGYSVLVNGTRITKDISSGDRVIAPGQTDELQIPASLTPPDITILAAMFADGSIEGDPAITARLKEWRLDLKEQLSRGLSVLVATLESSDVNSLAALDRLEAGFSSLSRQSDQAESRRANASQDARNDLFDDIQILRQRRARHGFRDQEKRLLELGDRLKRRIASL